MSEVEKVKFTAGRVERYQCKSDKEQSFLWDTESPGLGLRATANGAKAYIFQGKLNGQTIRITIGSPKSWSIDDAQAEARRLKVLIDCGQDPRQARAEEEAANKTKAEAAKIQEKRASILFSEAWAEYLKARKAKWSEKHYAIYIQLSALGGQKAKKGNKITKPGPLAALMDVPLSGLTPKLVAEWLNKESETRPANTAQSFRMLRAFIRWAADIPEYRGIIDTNIYSARIVRDAVPASKTKEGDSLQREQLALWFGGIKQIPNPIISAYLQALLLTGARRDEMAMLRWEDVDFQWRGLTIRDKVEGTRIIPLPPYLAQLLNTLPRRNGLVFSSKTSKSGRIQEPRIAHSKALITAGLPHVSLHGLRRSFGTLCEWVEMPSGISAQIMGHKPSALAEKHYRRRPLDLLRSWHDKIEAWILEQAGIKFEPEQAGLKLVTAA